MYILILLFFARYVSASIPGVEAPPLELGAIIVSALYAAATSIQLFIAIIYLLRARKGHHLPTVVAIPALIIFIFLHLSNIASVVLTFAVDIDGDLLVSPLLTQIVTAAGDFFFSLSDPFLFIFFFLLLRNRLHTCAYPQSRSFILLFDLAACFLELLMLVFSMASDGIQQDAVDTIYVLNTIPVDTLDSLDRKFNLSNKLFDVFIAMYVLATIFLTVYAVIVKKRVKNDTITNYTLFMIVPCLLLRCLARMIFAIIAQRSQSISSFNLEIYDFTSTFILGFLYFFPLSITCHFWVWVNMWVKGEEAPTQQYKGQYFQAAQFQGMPQLYHNGMQPPAQFPGQWGFTGQPVSGMQGYGAGQQIYPPPQEQGYNAGERFHPMTQENTGSSGQLPLKSHEAGAGVTESHGRAGVEDAA